MSKVFFEAADLFSARQAGEDFQQGPVTTVPGRVPSSIRRTSHIDVLRPHGITGDLLMVGGGRDLTTSEPGHGAPVRNGSMRLEISTTPEHRVQSISAGGVEGNVQDLIGANIFGGFRRSLAAVATGSDAGSVGLSLLDDAPVATVVAGYVPFRRCGHRRGQSLFHSKAGGVPGLEGRRHRRGKPGPDRQRARAPRPSGSPAAEGDRRSAGLAH